MKRQSVITNSSDETIRFAKKFARKLCPGSVLCLEGDLGSGKTTFMKGLAEGLGLKNCSQVKSPTFVLMHVYKARVPLYHFDCYRIDGTDELSNIGVSDFAGDPEVITCVEWAEKARELIPPYAVRICFKILGVSRRRLVIC